MNVLLPDRFNQKVVDMINYEHNEYEIIHRNMPFMFKTVVESGKKKKVEIAPAAAAAGTSQQLKEEDSQAKQPEYNPYIKKETKEERELQEEPQIKKSQKLLKSYKEKVYIASLLQEA